MKYILKQASFFSASKAISILSFLVINCAQGHATDLQEERGASTSITIPNGMHEEGADKKIKKSPKTSAEFIDPALKQERRVATNAAQMHFNNIAVYLEKFMDEESQDVDFDKAVAGYEAVQKYLLHLKNANDYLLEILEEKEQAHKNVSSENVIFQQENHKLKQENNQLQDDLKKARDSNVSLKQESNPSKESLAKNRFFLWRWFWGLFGKSQDEITNV